MAETQWIYLFDRNNGNAFMYASILEDGQTMPDNATTVECPQGLYDPYFDESLKTWKGITKEEWEAKHPQQPAQPTDGAQAMNALGLQVAQLTADSKALKKSVNELGLQVAQAIANDKKENGGN